MLIGRAHILAALCLLINISEIRCNGQECGANPMKDVLVVAKRTGRTLTHVLTLLKDIDKPAYSSLARKFRLYAACVGLVDTGYFRKRSESVPKPLPQNDDPLSLSSALDSSIEYQSPQDLNIPGSNNKIADSPNLKSSDINNKYELFQKAIKESLQSDSIKHEETAKQEAQKKDLPFEVRTSADLERLKKWLTGPYKNLINAYYIRYNIIWPMVVRDAVSRGLVT